MDCHDQLCEKFLKSPSWSQGNQNNFVSAADCRRACRKQYSNPCVGEPAKYPSGAPIFCSLSNRDTCPVNFWFDV